MALASLALLTALPGMAQTTGKAMEAKIDKVMARMTLDEKVGQMTELAIDMFGKFEGDEFVVNQQALDTFIGKYKVGSVLNAPGRGLTPQNWNKVIRAINKASLKTMGIPTLYGLDQNHGATYTLGGTLFPQPINMAASFNTELMRRAGEITAYETRAADCPWTYSPTMDLGRDARWPRIWESFGEDCLVNAEFGRAATLGFQGTDPNHVDEQHIAACPKHYMAYGVPRTGKDRTPAYVPEFLLREKYFKPFQENVRAGALSLMVNSASVNGVPMHVNKHYLTGWLKEEAGFDGMIVSDWADINNLYTREHVAETKKEAIAMAVNAGVDMSMVPYDVDFPTMLKEAVEEGLVPQSRIDDAVRRILRMKFRLGLFDKPDTDMKKYPKYGSQEFAKESEDAAVETMVLLKNNENLLPLRKGIRVLVTGPNANTLRPLDGGWSYTWQGDADKYAKGKFTILEALKQKLGAENVKFAAGVTYKMDGKYYEENTPDIDAAVKAAEGVDLIIACIGENSYTETPGNLNDLRLSENQRNLVKALAKTGKKILLLLNEGRPRIIADIEPLATAVVDLLIPGENGAPALARLLMGEDNFSGRLPYTYPRFDASLTTYDYRVSEQVGTMEGAYDYNAQVDVQWPFGFGKSYTTFTYGELQVDKPDFTLDDVLNVKVNVTNSGSVAGKESVLLFSRDLVASMVPEMRRLRAFTKIELKPGETKTVEFRLPARDLAFVGNDGKWHLEKGKFMLQAGDKTATVNCRETKDF